jgi:phosphoglycolate phosphatase-like HAD superfamily hydrolase
MRRVNGHGAVAVLFDIDGTLITTGGAGAVAWRRAFDDLYGIPADIGASSDAGMTDPEVGLRTFVDALGREPSNGELERVMERRLAYLPWAVAQSEGYRVLAGVESLLPRLAGSGYLLGLTTGGVEPAARVKLARAGLNRWFDFGGFGSDSTDRTELTRRAVERAFLRYGGSLDPSRCLVVGDTPLDISAAHGAGAVAVGVATGHFSAAQLHDAGADHVLTTLEEELPL